MSLLSRIVDGVISTVGAIGRKAKVTDIIKSFISWIPGIVFDLGAIKDASAAEKIDAAVLELKRFTGSEPGAIDIIKDLPADKENELFDALAKVIEIMAKHQARVPGYFVPGVAAESDAELLNALAMSGLDKALEEKIGGGKDVIVPLNISVNALEAAGGAGTDKAVETDSHNELKHLGEELAMDAFNPNSVMVYEQIANIRQAVILLIKELT